MYCALLARAGGRDAELEEDAEDEEDKEEAAAAAFALLLGVGRPSAPSTAL